MKKKKDKEKGREKALDLEPKFTSSSWLKHEEWRNRRGINQTVLTISVELYGVGFHL